MITGGNEIVIELFPDADMDKVRIVLLGSIFDAVLSQRGLLVLHGSSVEYAVPLRCIYEICSADIAEPEIEHLKGAERFVVLLKNLYRPQVLDDEGMRNVCHARAAEVLRSADVRRVTRPQNGFSPHELAAFLETEWDSEHGCVKETV
jgi:hypothetical protein